MHDCNSSKNDREDFFNEYIVNQSSNAGHFQLEKSHESELIKRCFSVIFNKNYISAQESLQKKT